MKAIRVHASCPTQGNDAAGIIEAMGEARGKIVLVPTESENQ